MTTLNQEWSLLHCHSVRVCPIAQSCLTLWDPMDCNPPGSSVHGIFPAWILEWVAISYSRGSSLTRDQTCVSFSGRWILSQWANWEAHIALLLLLSIQSCPTLCDPIDGEAHQAPPSLGFSRQDHWSGLPFPSPTHIALLSPVFPTGW